MIRFVTSFSPDGYARYANKMLESVVENWNPSNLKLTAYYHDFDPEVVKTFPKSSHIEYRNLNEIQDMLDYRIRMAMYDGTAGGKTPYNWRMDAIKWCHKVYALTDYILDLSEKEVKAGWVCWLDADTVTTSPVSEKNFKDILPNNAEIVHLGRKDVDYSETSFIGFNLDYQTPYYLIADLKGCYDIGEVISYREWHDGFIFERLLKIYEAHGSKVHNLTPAVEGLEAFKNSPLSQYMVHYKGALKNNIPSDTEVAPDVKLPRYRQLADLVRTYATDKIIEVGTWNGGRAIEMSLAAFEKSDKVHYVGFDLFEEATEELDKKELNSKRHNTIVAIGNRLQEFADKMKQEKGKEFTFELHKGDSKETMVKAKESLANANFAYIDGGHSEETVFSDYANLKHCPVIVFDDYFTKDPEGNILDDEYLGTNRLVETFKDLPEGKAIVLPSTDRVKGGGITHLVLLLQKDGLPPLPESLTKVPIVVQPRDSMPKEYIIDSINENLKLIENWGVVQTCPPNTEHAIIVSAGPSINWIELKHVIEETKGTVICVKHSYPKLLQNNIDPFGCLILDPRPIDGVSTHGIVRKDLFSVVDAKTKFLIASMTDPSVTKHLLSMTDNIYGWHAFSQAVQDAAKGKGKFGIDKRIDIPQDTTFVTGGTCSAMRAIGFMHILGFRSFHLFGFDCSIPNFKDSMASEKTEDGKQKYLQVETNGKKFWTTGELLAMAQDCERLFNNKEIEMNIHLYGEGTLVNAVFEGSYHSEKKYWRKLFR